MEIPSGLWADIFSRRRLLTVAPLVTGAGYALWTWLPSYPAFAAGFVLWGVGSSLRSGTLQALVYEELERWGRADSYARLMGRSQALGTTATMAATALAGPVLHLGSYAAVGAASVAVCLIGALVGRSFPETRGGRDGPAAHGAAPDDAGSRADSAAGAAGAPEGTPVPESTPGREGASAPEEAAAHGTGDSGEPGFLTVLRAGLGELRGSRPARNAVLLTAAVTGALMIDEYVPLLIGSMDVDVSTVPLLMLLVTVGVAAGGWCAGRGARLLGPALAVGTLALAAGALTGPAGVVLLAFAFGVFQWAMVTCDAMLQDRLADGARATVSSVAGFGAEVVSVLLCAGYALGSQLWAHSTLFVLAAVPYLLIALVLLWHGHGHGRGRGRGRGRARGRGQERRRRREAGRSAGP